MTDRAEAGAAAAEVTGQPVSGVASVGGAVWRAALADGRAVLVKHHPRAGAAQAEATGLAWLAEPGAVPVPAVHGWREHWLVTDYVPAGRPGVAAAEEFGRGLAELHAAGAPTVGSPPPGGPARAWIGLAPMRDEPGEHWPAWYAAHRVRPYLRAAVDQGALSHAQAGLVETVCERIDELAGPPPARLHGDLWSGNVHWAADGRAWLIDPAAHGGHRETDLAMLALFGCPHLDRVLAAYHEHTPLADGWQDRVALHQLFPLLVHTVLFGGGYAAQTVAAARAALRA